MNTLIVADADPVARQEFIDLFTPAGFHVVGAGSVVELISELRGRPSRVLLLGGELNGLPSVDLLPLLRKCSRELSIILMAEELPLESRERIGAERLVVYGPRPEDSPGWSRLLHEVRCAFEKETRKGGNDADAQ